MEKCIDLIILKKKLLDHFFIYFQNEVPNQLPVS